MNSTKTPTLPPRSRQTESEVEKEAQNDSELLAKQNEFVKGAALHTSPPPEENEDDSKKYPWRKHHANTPLDVLWGTKVKKTFEIPQELDLRLSWLKQELKPERYGEKNTEVALLMKAWDEFSARELRKMGFDIKKQG
ncbi:hypothetical protein [Acinetobacter modestus]|uniref:hypothetical protein n=1 Tax=Acinetobacter modestus TaxID=1776740 RepID=UPI003017F170